MDLFINQKFDAGRKDWVEDTSRVFFFISYSSIGIEFDDERMGGKFYGKREMELSWFLHGDCNACAGLVASFYARSL